MVVLAGRPPRSSANKFFSHLSLEAQMTMKKRPSQRRKDATIRSAMKNRHQLLRVAGGKGRRYADLPF